LTNAATGIDFKGLFMIQYICCIDGKGNGCHINEVRIMTVAEGYFAIFYKDKESGTIGVKFPEHPGVITYGRDYGEALKMAREALSAALEADFERGFELVPTKKPKLKRGEKTFLVRLPPDIWMAYLLRYWRERAGLTQKQLASELGISYQAYQRMERPGRSNVTIQTLERIAEALDRKLVLEIRPKRNAG
jgi:predicted RNase H-like HicB family nuclease/DNA-binding XRE family transcriptional regulator